MFSKNIVNAIHLHEIKPVIKTDVLLHLNELLAKLILLIKHEHYKACGVIWELRSQTWQWFHRAEFGLFLDIIPFSSKNSLSSCQGRKHPWVKEAFGQRPTVALQEVMDRCRCYLQAATSLWLLRLQGRWEEETCGRLGGRRARILLLHFQMYATLQRLARLPQPDRFCMRARIRTNVSLGVSGQTCRVNFPGSVMRPPTPPLKYGAWRMVGAVCAKVDKMFQKEKKKKKNPFWCLWNQSATVQIPFWPPPRSSEALSICSS